MRTPYREFGSLVILTPAWSPRKLCKIEYKSKRLLIKSEVAPRALCDSSPLKAETGVRFPLGAPIKTMI